MVSGDLFILLPDGAFVYWTRTNQFFTQFGCSAAQLYTDLYSKDKIKAAFAVTAVKAMLEEVTVLAPAGFGLHAEIALYVSGTVLRLAVADGTWYPRGTVFLRPTSIS